MSYVRISIDGANGSGKSGTSARLAVGLAKHYGEGRPVLIADSEDRARKSVAAIFAAEKIPLIVMPGETLQDVQNALERARAENCSVFIADQLTTPWMNGLKEFAYENGNLPFDRRQQLMNQWEEIVHRFRYGKFHAIACGRLGYWWENVEDPETGDIKLVQGDSKFNAGGSANFGYECDLELEIRRRKKRLTGWISGKTSVEHVCDVIKDALADATGLNGAQFVFQETGKPYQPGDYRKVLDAFKPHVEYVCTLNAPEYQSHSTPVIGGKTAWAKDQSERKGLLEEIAANLDFCFPGGEGKSKLAKMFRDLTLEALNGFISVSRMEEECSTEHLRSDLKVIQAMRRRVEDRQIPTDHNSLLMLLKLSADDVALGPMQHVAERPTLNETMMAESLPTAKKQPRNGKPQPIVAAMDLTDPEEMAGD